MKFKIFILLLGVFITFIGFRYRFRQYDYIPSPSTTFDEQGYLWLGKSLLNTGIPANWSALDIYQKHVSETNADIYIENYNIRTTLQTPSLKNWSRYPKPLFKNFESDIDGYRSQFLLVQPYLDNPPLYGIILALFDKGITIFSSTVSQIRLFSLITGTATIFIIFLATKLNYGLVSAIFSSIIYAIGPGYVISSRLALPENLISLLFILTIYLLFLLKKYPKIIYPIAFLSFLCPLIKIPGLIIPIALFIYFTLTKKYHYSLLILFSSILGFITYLIYGYYYDNVTLINVLKNQGQRQFQGPLSMLIKTLYPQIPYPMFDGWIILGYLSILHLLINRYLKKSLILLCGFSAYFLFFLSFGGNNFPWYQFIIFPLLSISLGIFIHSSITDFRFYYLPLFFITVFSSNLHYANILLDWGKYLNIYRLSIFIFILIPGINYLFIQKYQETTAKISLLIMFIISVILSTRVINNMQVIWPILLSKPYPL